MPHPPYIALLQSLPILSERLRAEDHHRKLKPMGVLERHSALLGIQSDLFLGIAQPLDGPSGLPHDSLQELASLEQAR
ncbi:hypothetical protein D3C77_280060 [compost metagenome]